MRHTSTDHRPTMRTERPARRLTVELKLVLDGGFSGGRHNPTVAHTRPQSQLLNFPVGRFLGLTLCSPGCYNGPMTTPHYKAIGKQIVERIERKYGKNWRSCFKDEVARDLVASQAFFVMSAAAREDQTGEDLERHSRTAMDAALELTGLSDS